MILWKCWRDLRVFVFVGLGWLALLLAGALAHPHMIETSPQFAPNGMDVLAAIMGVFVNVQTFTFAFLAWGMGTRGIGRDIGNGIGYWMLTRPARRPSFVWIEWLSGLAAIALLLALTGLFYWGTLRFHFLRIGYMRLDSHNHPVWVESAVSSGATAISVLCAFLLVALIFSVTHCGTTLFRHSTRGLLFCIGFLVAWLLLGWEIYLHLESWAPYYPDLLFQPFIDFPRNVHLVPHAATSILERLAVLPLFPLIAQLFLCRAEV